VLHGWYQVARLRAEVFYEESFSRFVASLKKQFAEKVTRPKSFLIVFEIRLLVFV
jgi:hypothetical protein